MMALLLQISPQVSWVALNALKPMSTITAEGGAWQAAYNNTYGASASATAYASHWLDNSGLQAEWAFDTMDIYQWAHTARVEWIDNE